jgi:tetratricopeptide (TPR) repeat protein
LQQAYGIGDDDSPETVCEKVRQGVEEAGLDPDEWAPYLLRAAGISTGTERLAGLSREVIKLRTAEVLRRITVERSRNTPLVLAIDDLHLAGRSAEEFLLQITQELPTSRVLLLTTYRPGYRLPWGDRPYVTQFGLQPLSRGKSWTLLRHLLPIEQQPLDLIPHILDSAGGNPLFLEELARAVAEKHGEGDTLHVPDALRETLLSQTSRLSDGARRLLAFISVIGDRAPLRLVERLMVRPRGLAPLLAELRKHEILHEKSARGEMLFFEHGMMSLAVYESLPVEERQRLHAAVGAALEELHAGRLQDVYHLLAYHYGRSADSVKAIQYLPHLFQKTGQKCALPDVVAALERALEHAGRLPMGAQRDTLMIDLVTREAHALVKMGRLEGARDLLLRHLPCAEGLNSPQFAGPFFLALAGATGFLGEALPAENWVRRAVREGDVGALSKAGDGLTLYWLWAGRFDDGIENGWPVVARPATRRERERTGQAMWGQGMNCILIGQLNQAIDFEDAAWKAATEAGDTRLECFAAFTKGWAHALRGDWLKGLAACRRAVELAPDPLAAALAKAWLGGVCVEMEDWEQATFALFQAYDRFHAWKCRPSRALVCAWLSDAFLGRGQLQRAGELAREGLALSEEFGFPFTQALARRALGRIARARDAREESEGHFQAAYKGFESLGAAYEGARTLLDLAALDDASGRPEPAAIHLATARKTFSDLGVAFYATRPVVLTGRR